MCISFFPQNALEWRVKREELKLWQSNLRISVAHFQFTGELSFEFDRTAVLRSANQYWSGTNDLVDFTCRYDASVTDQGSNLTETGYSTTEILNPRAKLVWIGDKVRTFKPDSVFTVYVSILYNQL